MPHRILVINPGSTTTKLSLYEDRRETARFETTHSAEELSCYIKVIDQAGFRLELVKSFLKTGSIDIRTLSAAVGRGGLLKPLPGGVYRVNEAMLSDLESARYGEHASNLGALLAWKASQEAGCPAFIVDPVTVNEMEDAARLTGLHELERKSIFHALNQKSTARETAERIGKPYEKCSFIVAHLGGGISVGAHRNGRVVDVNNALDGEGPFSPERSGSLPAGDVVRLCFSGKHTEDKLLEMISRRGGLIAHRGSNSLSELRTAAESGDAKARLLLEAMTLRISQEICKHGATLNGKVDRIILTGGMAHDEVLMDKIIERVRHLAPVVVLPGEREMLSLALGALAVLEGREEEKKYTREN